MIAAGGVAGAGVVGTDLVDRVWAALDGVLDPELDEPVTDLGFVRSVEAAGGVVRIHLRLPTSFCSPNFAFLMASDTRDAVAALPGVGDVVVALDDHHDSERINAGLAAGADFAATFGAEAEGGLDELRATFRRKAHTAVMERALTALLHARPDLTEADVAGVRLGDLPDGRERDLLVARRRALGFGTADGDPVLVDDRGLPVSVAAAPAHLRRARLQRLSIDGNAHFCRGLLRTRYPGSGADQAPRPEGTDAVPVPLLPSRTRRHHP